MALRFPPHSKKRHLFPRPRNAFPRTPALASRFSCLFYHGENVPCGIPKPGNGGTISTHNAFLVCLEIGQIIDLEADPSPRQFIDRTIDIFRREVQNGKGGRKMVGLWINENIIATGEVQREDAVRFRNVQAECCRIEFLVLGMSPVEKPPNALLSFNIMSFPRLFFTGQICESSGWCSSLP